MQQSNHETTTYQENEINFVAVVHSILARKFLIASLTIFMTVLAILYVLNLVPTYQTTSSFTSPSRISVTTINKLNLTEETKKSIFSKFLTQLSSKEFQRQVFIEGDFLTLFNTNNKPINDIDAFISKNIRLVRVNSPDVTMKYFDLGFLTELPYSVTMKGVNPEAISEYLNTLVSMANSKTVIGLSKHNELKIANRIDEISLERDLLLEQAKRYRLNQIERIKEEDGQKIRQINDQVDRARYKAKEERLNQIIVLIDSAKLAKSLGIIENNFKLINDDGVKSDLTIAIGENKNLPEWYLYGEKALMQRVELLENRMSDDPFIPELVTLNNQLNEVQLNNALKTLEARQDDSPYIIEIVKLEIEKIKLKSRIVDMSGVSSMQLSQISKPPKSPNKQNKRMIVLLAFIVSFMISILLALIMDALKRNKKAPA